MLIFKGHSPIRKSKLELNLLLDKVENRFNHQHQHHHQGVLLHCEKLNYKQIDFLEKIIENNENNNKKGNGIYKNRMNSLWVAIDSIQDPQVCYLLLFIIYYKISFSIFFSFSFLFLFFSFKKLKRTLVQFFVLVHFLELTVLLFRKFFFLFLSLF